MTDDHPNAEDYFNRAQRAEQECAELREENARLREALKFVVRELGNAVETVPGLRSWLAYDAALSLARAALGENRDAN